MLCDVVILGSAVVVVVVVVVPIVGVGGDGACWLCTSSCHNHSTPAGSGKCGSSHPAICWMFNDSFFASFELAIPRLDDVMMRLNPTRDP